MNRSYSVITLGCKVNQCESAAIGRLLEEWGWERTDPEKAAVCIINTCAVTMKAAMQSRQAARRIARANPKARIIVTGCYAQIDPAELASIDGISMVADNSCKHLLASLVAAEENHLPAKPAKMVRGDISKCRKFQYLPASVKGTRTRAFLKIQDGCDSFCTYCIVPYARGPSRSMPPDKVIQNLSSLAREGVKEVVLTGVHLGQYGQDLSGAIDLVSILDRARTKAAIERIRLSSIEPAEIGETLLERIVNRQTGRGRICDHLHIPLQSGDDKILKRMHRPYDRNLFSQLVKTIRHLLPNAAIGVDVLVGFPGEDESAFNNTLELLENLPVSYLHVFPFSPRPGTPAWYFKDKVDPKVIKQRCLQLRRLSEIKRRNFYSSLIGEKLEVLIETTCDKNSGFARGLSSNYVQVFLVDSRPAANTLVSVEITSLNDDLTVIGKLV